MRSEVHVARLSSGGVDIEPRFVWTDSKERLYYLVTLVFVVNVLPTTEDRLAAVRRLRAK